MSGVILRCRTCGTTQDHAGECEACRDGTVAYYCGNHAPGLWLDTSVCSTCGARYGDAVPSAPRRPARSTEGPPTSPRGRVDATPTTPASAPRDSRVSPRRSTPAAHERPVLDEDPAASSLAELLVDMAEEARRSVPTVSRRPSPPVGSSRTALPWLGGCALRLVLLVLFLVVFTVLAAFVLVGGLMVR